MKTLMTLTAAIAFLALPPGVRADDRPTMKYSGAAATEIVRSLKGGNGWCMVSARQKVALLANENPVDCVRYRVAVQYTATKGLDQNSNPQDLVEVTFGAETDWIAIDLKMPTQSGPSLSAAKAANTAISELDVLLPILQELIAKEEDAKIRADGAKAVAALKRQRAALADLIQKDVAAIDLLVQ